MTDGDLRREMAEFNGRKYDEFWSELNAKLQEKEKAGGVCGLTTALQALEMQQFDKGFIQDDLKSVVRYRLVDPSNRQHHFTIQYNPRRALRQSGAGRTDPPPDAVKVNNGCFLCKENMRWQQRGIEAGYDLQAGERQYIAFMNPFPLMQTHTTIATAEHMPQSWIGPDTRSSGLRMQEILHDLLSLTKRVPGFVGFYNGDGAGATIPQHFHFQFFRRVAGQEPFALERAARRAIAEHDLQGGEEETRNCSVVIRDFREYPIAAICFRGKQEFIVECARQWVEQWTEFYRNSDALSANIICTVDAEKSGLFHLYFVPRNKYVSHSVGMAGLVGGLEVFGELVFSAEVEHELLQSGRVDFGYVAHVINGVEAPGVQEFLNRILPSRG
jgi:hypothetical protein